MKEDQLLKFVESQSLLSECSLHFIFPSKIYQMSDNVMIYERDYYSCDLKSIIYTKCLSLSEIYSIMIRLSEVLMMLCECDIVVSNLKSSNIIYENNEVKLVDLCLNQLRRKDDMRIDDVCYMNMRELFCLESNIEDIYIWKLGCILYELLTHKLPFYIDGSKPETIRKILKCEYERDIVEDKVMKGILLRMLKVEKEDRLSLIEFKKEMIKENEILRDSENNVMIIEERKEVLLKNVNAIVTLPVILSCEYYLKSDKWEEIRDNLTEKYNNKANERILSILLMMKLYKGDDYIKYHVKFQAHHKCKERKDKCWLDKMIFNIFIHKEYLVINSNCICLCEEGIKYSFRILKLINPTKLIFDKIKIPVQSQSSFGLCFSQLSNLQELYLSKYNLTFQFIESFVKSIPSMKKLEYVDLESNPIGARGFKLLLPYLHLLINNKNELNLCGMDLNDESMILLSSELHKYPNLKIIDITENDNIHSPGLKSLLYTFPISKIKFHFNGNNKELLIDKEIPNLIEYINNLYVDLSNSEIDDEIFKSFISLRLNELRRKKTLDLRYNQLTFESIKTLINNLSSLPNLKLQLFGNPIGDVGMNILSPHLNLLKDYKNKIDCSKMGLSSTGLLFLLNGLKAIHQKIKLDISENSIDLTGIEYLNNYMKENDNIEGFSIHNNPIGNSGFLLLLCHFDKLENYNYDMLNLENISIDDVGVKLLINKLNSIKTYFTIINLEGNNVRDFLLAKVDYILSQKSAYFRNAYH